ncbi:MAG: hypothetical protein C0518_15070, partial [Opitutus sp.]|nr:hypothetical protein [Opitutus sp.]
MLTLLRPAVRSLARARAFSLTVVLILAVGIGVSTAVFSVLHAVVLRPLPYANPAQLARVWSTMPQRNNVTAPVSHQRVQFLQPATGEVFSQIATVSNATYTVGGRGDPELLTALKVSGPFFDLLGVRPLLGRAFTADEDRAGAAPVVIVSEAFWKRALAAAPDAVGQTLLLNGEAHTLVGVMPATFTTPFDGNELWVPRAFEAAFLPATSVARGAGFLQVIARLAPGVTLERAQAVLTTVVMNYPKEFPGFMDESFGLQVNSMQEEISGPSRRPLWLLFGAVAVVLLISCVNVANLCLTRTLGLRRAIAVRTALGASRSQVLRQFFAEGLLLAGAAGVLGCAFAAWSLPLLSGLAANYVPRWSEVGLNLPVLAFALATAAACGVLFGAVPWLQVSAISCQEALRDGARGTTRSPANLRFRQALLAAEVALALVLTVGAGLLVVSFARAQRVNAGFRTEGLFRAAFPLAGADYAEMSRRADFVDRMLEKVRQTPGIESAAAVLGAPFANESSLFTAVLPGRPANDPKERHIVRYGIATAGYFSVLGTPLMAGREFTESDARSGDRVVIVNETMARRLYPEGSALEREFIRPYDGTAWRIVGIVQDLRTASLVDPLQPEAYFPHRGSTYTQISLLVRAKGDASLAVAALRGALREIDSKVPLVQGRAVTDMMAESLSQRRFAVVLLLVFASASALLAAAGIGA